jgi:hypothetical protein
MPQVQIRLYAKPRLAEEGKNAKHSYRIRQQMYKLNPVISTDLLKELRWKNPEVALEMRNKNRSLMGIGGGIILTFGGNPLIDL